MRRDRYGVVVVAMLIWLSVVVFAHAGEWRAKEQPDLKLKIVEAEPLYEVGVGIPITTVQLGPQWWAPNPDGKTHDVIQWYYPSYLGPNIGAVMDLGSGVVKQIRMPPRQQCRGGTILGPDGKIYHASVKLGVGMNLHIYDPTTNEFTDHGVIVPDLGGEKNDLTIGTDGKIYGTGSYGALGRAGAYQIDPVTGKVTNYGPIGPSHKPEGVWGYSLAADDRYVYVASGKIPWYLVAYDRQTGKDEVILETARAGEDLQIRQLRHGAIATRYLGFKGTYVEGGYERKVEYWLYQGRAIEKKDPNEAPPWPMPKDSKPWVSEPPRPETWQGRLQPTRDGAVEFWYRYRWQMVEEVTAAGELPEARGWKVIRFKTPMYENRRTTWVRELPDGRIFGQSDAYQGNFIYDPQTEELTHLGKIHLSQYSAVIHDGKVWLCGYPSSALYVYDWSRPWTANTTEFMGKTISERAPDANPRYLLVLRTWSGVHHPYAAAVGANGLLYFGGRWYRDGIQGGLAWYDPKTGAAGGLRDPFNNYQIHYATTAAEGTILVLSTRAVEDRARGVPKPSQGCLFVLDTARNQVVRTIEPVANLDSTGPILGVGGTRVLGMCSDPDDPTGSLLYGVDVGTGQVAFRKKLPFALEWRVRHDRHDGGMFDFRLGPDGKVWTFIGNALVRINPEDAEIEVVGMARIGGSMAFSGRDLYLSGSVELRKVPDVIPEK